MKLILFIALFVAVSASLETKHAIKKRHVQRCHSTGCITCNEGNCYTSCRGSDCNRCPNGNCCTGSNCNSCHGSSCCKTSSCNSCVSKCQSSCSSNECHNDCVKTCRAEPPCGSSCNSCVNSCQSNCVTNSCRRTCPNTCQNVQTSDCNECSNRCINNCVADCEPDNPSCAPACREACNLSCNSKCGSCSSDSCTRSENANVHNITTVLSLKNYINNTNIINMPINVSNYNHLAQEEMVQQPQRCCYMIHPTQCHNIPQPPYQRCIQNRHKICGETCTSPVVHRVPISPQIVQHPPVGFRPACTAQTNYQVVHQQVPQQPAVSCGNYGYQDCGSCYVCGGTYNPPVCSTQPSCPSICQGGLYYREADVLGRQFLEQTSHNYGCSSSFCGVGCNSCGGVAPEVQLVQTKPQPVRPQVVPQTVHMEQIQLEPIHVQMAPAPMQMAPAPMKMAPAPVHMATLPVQMVPAPVPMQMAPAPVHVVQQPMQKPCGGKCASLVWAIPQQQPMPQIEFIEKVPDQSEMQQVQQEILKHMNIKDKK